jgi:enoyl-CoA hydratase/carnithine racemase
MMTGRIISPEEAFRLGAVSRVVTRAELDPVVDDIVNGLAAKSPAVMMLGRDAFDGVVGIHVDAALELLQAGLTAVALTDDSREGVAAFIEKRAPRWTGR